MNKIFVLKSYFVTKLVEGKRMYGVSCLKFFTPIRIIEKLNRGLSPT